jgi:hypothetical protein
MATFILQRETSNQHIPLASATEAEAILEAPARIVETLPTAFAITKSTKPHHLWNVQLPDRHGFVSPGESAAIPAFTSARLVEMETLTTTLAVTYQWLPQLDLSENQPVAYTATVKITGRATLDAHGHVDAIDAIDMEINGQTIFKNTLRNLSAMHRNEDLDAPIFRAIYQGAPAVFLEHALTIGDAIAEQAYGERFLFYGIRSAAAGLPSVSSECGCEDV